MENSETLKKISETARKNIVDDYFASWTEIVTEYEDDLNYLTFYLYKQPEDEKPVLHIEFGVSGDDAKQPMGCYKGIWLMEHGLVEKTISSIHGGEEVSPDDLFVHLETYLGYKLPLVSHDLVETD